MVGKDRTAGATVTAHLVEPTEILGRITRALEAAGDPQQVLDVVLAEIRGSFALDRAAIRRVDDVMLEIVAVWSTAPTALGVGTRMSVASSSLPAILSTGRPVVASRADPGGFLHEMVIAEGVASYVTLPLRVDGVIRGLLSFSSRMPDAFTEEELPFLERLAGIVEARSAELGLG